MKLIIASDIHGCAPACRSLLDHARREQPDRLVLLGDLLYHGPRNALPAGYDPAAVAVMLNEAPWPITAVRGNCDAEVDQMVLNFPCRDTSAVVVDGPRTLFCTHGHVLSPDEHPALGARAALLSGHTHAKTLDERDGILYVNPGSPSIPKDGSASFAVYEDGVFTLRELEGGRVVAEAQL
ncbi:phosphodiesterase [Adlercreutzia sp. R7]|uniref:Phosphoesterase n=1 Tax=Adlercreutzia wanghongyangiae TaxID=3111451 RepID=A0ABU6IGM5_9ACTN|nr:phosphodiesterase [Adlercreutzia sp. R7]